MTLLGALLLDGILAGEMCKTGSGTMSLLVYLVRLVEYVNLGFYKIKKHTLLGVMASTRFKTQIAGCGVHL